LSRLALTRSRRPRQQKLVFFQLPQAVLTEIHTGYPGGEQVGAKNEVDGDNPPVLLLYRD
jgi:hypothetical protein